MKFVFDFVRKTGIKLGSDNFCSRHFLMLLLLGIFSIQSLCGQRTAKAPDHEIASYDLQIKSHAFQTVSGKPRINSLLFQTDSGKLKISFLPSQTDSAKPRISSNPKFWIVAGGHAAIWGGTFAALNNAWYKDYPKSSFHFFDDRKEWQQMDKAGHVWTAYQLSRVSAEAWKWGGMDERRAAWLGGASAFAFQSVIEILDGFSAEWGFSVGDMEANLIGSAGYVAQQLLFRDQIVQIKLGYKPYDYPGELRNRRDQLFGASLQEQLLKDYNSQRYWLSANAARLVPALNLPPWLNIAVGYSADGMFGGHDNTWTDKQGNYFDRRDIRRTRRFYIAPDIDLTKIKTGSKLLRSVFFLLNSVKIPAPTIEYNTRGKFRLHALMF